MNELLKKASGRIALTGILAASALILGLVESMLPTSFLPVPGIKLGLSNIAVLFAVYFIGKKEGFAVMTVKVLLSAILYAGINGLIYSASGALFSFGVICLLIRFRCFSVVGVSAAAGTVHNVGQLFAAIILLKTGMLIGYLPVLIISGCITGVLTGLITAFILKRQDLKRIV